MSDTMVERVARAIALCDGDPDDRSPVYADMARAAIQAMREPSHAMLEVGSPLSASQWGDHIGQHKGLRRAWQAMIDAALAEWATSGLGETRKVRDDGQARSVSQPGERRCRWC